MKVCLSLLPGAGAAVLVFSTTDRDSFDAIRSWRAKVEAECGSIPMTLVQNKIDLMDKATMTPEEVEGLARSLQMRLYRTCVKDNMNVGNGTFGSALAVGVALYQWL